MVDRRRDAIDLPGPTRTTASNGRALYGEPHDPLAYFICGEPVLFDRIFPVFIPASNRVFETKYNSTEDVDELIVALPVKDMDKLHRDISMAKSESAHNYLWMLRWLQTCLELSEITRSMIQDRIRYLRAQISEAQEALDRHIEIHITMEQNKTCDPDTLWKHTRQGFKREQQFNAAQDLLEAMDVVDILVHDLTIGHGTQLCPCDDCNIYYRSQEWHREQSFHSPMELPRTQYYRRCQGLRPGCSPTSVA